MSLIKQLTSRLFFRNMVDTLGFGKAYTTKPGGFIPFFQYKIGSYNAKDFFLYFDREPFAIRYKNEIFNKLFRYTVNDGKTYLSFHYDLYPDKPAFLDFLQDEISERSAGLGWKSQKIKLTAAREWVKKMHPHAQSEGETNSEGSQAEVEKTIAALQGGHIEVNDARQIQSIIQLLYILRDLDDSPDRSKGSPNKLFGGFTAIDVAAILRIHFKSQSGKQINTIQKMVTKAEKEVDRRKIERYKKLDAALYEYFYASK